MQKKNDKNICLHSAFVAGGFLVAQFVRIALDPSHCPFIAVIALSASCKKKGNIKNIAMSSCTIITLCTLYSSLILYKVDINKLLN